MFWPYNPKVPPIQCCNFSDVHSLCRGHDRCVDRAERQIPVAGNEFGNAEPVAGCDRLDGQSPSSEVTEKPHLRFGAQPRLGQICHLGDHQRRHYKRTRMVLQQLRRCVMVPVVLVEIGIQRTSVDEDRYGLTSARRISSMRSEMSSCPLRPAPVEDRRRLLPPRWDSIASRVSSEIVMPRRAASWRSLASSSSGIFTVVLLIVCQHIVSIGWVIGPGCWVSQLLYQVGVTRQALTDAFAAEHQPTNQSLGPARRSVNQSATATSSISPAATPNMSSIASSSVKSRS